MKEPSFWDKREWARAHQKPEPKLMLDNSRAAGVPMTVIPTKPVLNLASSINDPAARPPSDSEFGFDPKGPKVENIFWQHPVDAALALVQSELAKYEANRRYPGPEYGGGHNQAGDAFRHAYWNAAMARLLGPERAREYADAVEISSWNKAGERQMDLYNNREGRRLGLQPGLLTDAIEKAIKDGHLRTRPFQDR